MRYGRVFEVLVAALWCGFAGVNAQGQNSQTTEPAGGYRADNPHPRLLLTAKRLKLLRRERERQSMRWNQFQLLMAGRAPMPEPGFAGALYYQVAGDPDAGRRAISWALGSGADLRQQALVFDWCQELLSPADSKALAAKLERGIEQSRQDSSVAAVRGRLLAAVALAGHIPDLPEKVFAQVIGDWWGGQIVPALKAGRETIRTDDLYPLMEILHAVSDNFIEDLREPASVFFNNVAEVELLGDYPAAYPAGENDYRIPAAPYKEGEPDLRRAALARAAELSMVAFDANAPGSQVLQGWLMNDHFLMRGTFGAPYEFLWANPYQPGLSYYHTPLAFHDAHFGRLFARSSWEDSAAWLGLFSGELQGFQDGGVHPLDMHANSDPIDLNHAYVLFGARAAHCNVNVAGAEPVFVIGLEPRQKYLIEVDDEELSEAASDPGGILELDVPHDRDIGIRMRAGAAAASKP